jgi:hypothetical protein
MKITTIAANKPKPETETSYWTINPGRSATGAGVQEIQRPTAEDLMALLLGMGWKASEVARPENKFCLVRTTAGGVTETRFASYEAALAHDEAAAAKALAQGVS